jgi:RNA polymerase sigma-70 factor (ECF subfamily)
MLVAWRRLDDVPDDGTARLDLYGVARRVLANHQRGQIRRARLAERLAPTDYVTGLGCK